MEEAVTSVLEKYELLEIIILSIVFFCGYIIYIKVTDNDYYSKLHEIKQRHQANLWEYVAQELSLIESKSLHNVDRIIKSRGLDTCNNSCGMASDEAQVNMFALVLERVLYNDVFEKIKTATKQNGYYSKSKTELDQYIEEKAEYLLTYSRKRISLRVHYFKLLEGTEDERFTLDDAIKFYSRIVYKSIEIKNKEKAEIRELKQKYSLLSKLNIFAKLFSGKKKLKDDE